MIREFKLRLIVAAVILLSTILSACEGEDGIIGTGEKSDLVNGIGQKGPFIADSQVSISPLQQDNVAAPSAIITRTTDNLGNFKFSAELDTAYQISIQGVYLNELTGLASSQALTLNAVYIKQVSSKDISSVNVLTHLIYQRVLFLIVSGVSVVAAMDTAQQELLTFMATHVTLQNTIANTSGVFHKWTLYNINANNNVNGNAVLFYTTALFYKAAAIIAQQNNSDLDTELELYINNFATDFTDGLIEDPSIADLLRKANNKLDPTVAIKNLSLHSEQILGIPLAVADINSILDNDFDGLANNVDLDDDGDGLQDRDDENPFVFQLLSHAERPQYGSTPDPAGPASFYIVVNRPENVECTFRFTTLPVLGQLDYTDPIIVTRYRGLLSFIYTPNPDSTLPFTEELRYQFECPLPITHENYISPEVILTIERHNAA